MIQGLLLKWFAMKPLKILMTPRIKENEIFKTKQLFMLKI